MVEGKPWRCAVDDEKKVALKYCSGDQVSIAVIVKANSD